MEHKYLDDVVDRSQTRKFLLHVWNIVTKALKRRKVVSFAFKGLDLNNVYYDFEQRVYFALSLQRESNEKYGRLYLGPLENEKLEILVVQSLHQPLGKHGSLSGDRLIPLVENLAILAGSIERKSLAADIRERFNRSLIHLNDEDENTYEVILKKVNVSLNHETYQDDHKRSIRVAIEVMFYFEVVNVTALAPPLDTEYGGEEYERIKRETLIGK